MHRLSHIAIENFCCCGNVSLPLEGFTPLVGPNNAGKSTILQAIRWVLKPGPLAHSDFTDPAKALTVSACIEGITAEVLERIPDAKHRTAIEPYCRDGKLWIRAVAPSAGSKTVKQEVWQPDVSPEETVPNAWRDYPTGLPQAVSVLLPAPLFVEAMDDIGEDLGKAKAGTTIKALLDEVMEPVLTAHAEINSALETIRKVLTVDGENRSSHLKEFDKQATEALLQFFPGLELELDLQVMDVKEFFKAGDLRVKDKFTGDRRRFDQMGSGAQRSIQMALIRMLAESRAGSTRKAARRLLLIDEPELYLHPQGVRRLRQALANLSNSGFQVVFASHSPLMLSRENAADTVIVSKTPEGGVITRKPLRQAVNEALSEAESQSRTLFELGNLAEIYFAERVVLCEGKTDRRLLPLAYEVLFGHGPDVDHVAFVSLGSCSDIPKALPVLAAMGIKACAIADLDFAFVQARVGGNSLLPKDGAELVEAKKILEQLKDKHGFALGGNGLPTNKGMNGLSAAKTWAAFSADPEGTPIVEDVHQQLRGHNVWVWTKGSIEQVMGHEEKGEDAIIEQEERLRGMGAEALEHEAPELKSCFSWIKNL